MSGYAFGRCYLSTIQRQLYVDGEVRALGGKAIAILTALVERAGDIVSKEDLLRAAWPEGAADEAGLRVQISTLRKILRAETGEELVANVSGRGYRFIAPVTRGMPSAQCLAKGRSAPPRPPSLDMVGREKDIADLVALLEQRRLVTISGPGGIGKSTVAQAVAVRRQAEGRRALTVELAGLPAVTDLAALVATALDGDESETLLVLDNCEHLVEPTASLVEALAKSAPQLTVLATSREQLRADGEWLHRLNPLDLPPETCASATEALSFPTVALFVRRAASRAAGFTLTDAETPKVVEICRRLDGIPLAIELAAARLDALGLSGLTDNLNNRFAILTQGRRTALPRQQTLRATMDWSYELLTAEERDLIARLAVFTGRFSLDAAKAAAEEAFAPAQVSSLMSSLVAKSLVTADTSEGTAAYGLLETTRAYVSERLGEA